MSDEELVSLQLHRSMDEQALLQLIKSIEDREMKKMYYLTTPPSLTITHLQKKGTGQHTVTFMGVGARVLKLKKVRDVNIARVLLLMNVSTTLYQ